MIPKAKPTSSKPSFRWPWSKKRKGDQAVDPVMLTEQVNSAGTIAGQGCSQPEPMGSMPIVVSPNTATASSSEDRRLQDQTFKEASPCQFETSPAAMSSTGVTSSLFPNASNFVVKRLQIDASQHGSSSNDSGAQLLPFPSRLDLYDI